MGKPILCLDFDGVIHSYESGWKGATEIPDPPVVGALEFMWSALDHFEVHVFSSRSNAPYGIEAMRDWLRKWAVSGLETYARDDPNLLWVERIQWPKEKPPAKITIDDRAITFTGFWPDMEYLKRFEPWNKPEQAGFTNINSAGNAEYRPPEYHDCGEQQEHMK